jgi:hypothetical protein
MMGGGWNWLSITSVLAVLGYFVSQHGQYFMV